MELHALQPGAGSKKVSKRVGRGIGSGIGGRSGRGQDGQKSRSGYSRRVGFEGGQMPLIRRVPKRGFTNIFAKKYAIVNLDALNVFEAGSVVGPEDILGKRIVNKTLSGIKILGNGELNKALTVKCSIVSKSAKDKIEAAGGKVEVV
ncbi:MAG: 50S ribosomal protein L15 [Fusobacteria bacterium]|nr:50S ribosomal protein L15 [Fusobacteriota bacterium]